MNVFCSCKLESAAYHTLYFNAFLGKAMCAIYEYEFLQVIWVCNKIKADFIYVYTPSFNAFLGRRCTHYVNIH